MQSCRVTLLLPSPQLLFISFPSLLISPSLSFASPLLPLFPDLFPPVFARWAGHVPAASVAAPGLDGLRASHTHEGRLRAAHFASRGAKGLALEQRRGEVAPPTRVSPAHPLVQSEASTRARFLALGKRDQLRTSEAILMHNGPY